MKSVFAALAAVILLPWTSYAQMYDIDSAHTRVGFEIGHLGISTVRGQFGEFSGSFKFDEKKPSNSMAVAEINVGSIDTNNDKRDTHLRSEEFFNSQKFPVMKFKSTEVQKVGDGHLKVKGDLTIGNVTKPVTLDTQLKGKVTDPWGNERVGFKATTKLDRRDYGLTWSKLLETGGLVVDNEVTVLIDVEGIAQKS
ncbi:MAG: polyisoprenoid-binding protein [Bdellovibrionales bacterium]|nr:polyisoprenoid-binding protein [Bdellovibrionales bacterium]